MRQLIAILVLAVLTALVLFCCGEQKKDRPATISIPKAEVKVQIKNGDLDIRKAISEGQAFLKDKTAGFRVCQKKEKIPAGKKKGKTVYKYREKKAACDIVTILAVVDSNVYKRKGQQGIEVVRVLNGHTSDKGFRVVQTGLSNGVATGYTVEHPPGYLVLAARRVVEVREDFFEAVYTPFSKGLNVSVLREAGRVYLIGLLDRARAELERTGVRSLAFPKRRVTEVVPLDVAALLAITERVDPNWYKNGKKSVEEMVAEALVLLGANGPRAYEYSVSPDGARGMFQLMPDTYASVRQLYGKKVTLTEDFVEGAADHLNAAMAQLLLFDSDTSNIPSEFRAPLANNPIYLGIFLAAAYNGGAPKHADLIKKYGVANWQLHIFMPETYVYVEKFLATWLVLRFALSAPVSTPYYIDHK